MTTPKQNDPGLQLFDPNQSQPDTSAMPLTLNDIQPPVALSDPIPWPLYGAIGLASLLLAATLILWLKKRKKPVPPPIPPGIIARSELMKARELMTEERALSYMDRVSEILRTYIEARFALSPTRQTTREFFCAIAGNAEESRLLAPFREDLQECLESCDRAKFAHQGAIRPQMEAMEGTLLAFINTTSEEPETTKV